MAIDAYSPCPGGTGKKVKFCCPDLLGELQKIDRMLEGKQYQACLNHIETLLNKTPGRACLLATRTLVLLSMPGQSEAAAKSVAEFLRLHPDNPIALADSAIVAAAQQGGREAMQLLQRAIAASGTGMDIRVYVAMSDVAEALISEGNVMAAMPLLQAQVQINPKDRRPQELLSVVQNSSNVPTLMKYPRPLPGIPPDMPWTERFREVLETILQLRWPLAVDRLTALIGEVGDEPILWQTLAMLRGWLADNEGCIEALRKYASLDVSLDEAVEAETLALMLSDDPLGDSIGVLSVTYDVDEVEQLEAALTLSRELDAWPVDAAALPQSEEPPPRAIYHVYDRAMPAAGPEADVEDLPKLLATALVYGRQTDRPARLELIGVRSDDLDRARAVLANAAGDRLGGEIDRKQIAEMSRSEDLIVFRRRLPNGIAFKRIRELVFEDFQRTVLDRWPRLPLGYLGGKTPEEAAGTNGCRVKVLAAVMLLESWLEKRKDGFDFDRLRERLGLPLPEPIDPEEVEIERLPVVYWPRLIVERLPDDRLIRLFRIARSCNAISALRRLCQAIIDRPSLEGKGERFFAYAFLGDIEMPSDRALEYIDRGRKEAEAAGRSSAPWDLQELTCRFARIEAEEVARLLVHIDTQHGREPGVRESLIDFLVQVGVLQPDKSPGVPVRPGMTPPSAGAADAEVAPGKLWTPESQRPTGGKPRIWTPGMD